MPQFLASAVQGQGQGQAQCCVSQLQGLPFPSSSRFGGKASPNSPSVSLFELSGHHGGLLSNQRQHPTPRLSTSLQCVNASYGSLDSWLLSGPDSGYDRGGHHQPQPVLHSLSTVRCPSLPCCDIHLPSRTSFVPVWMQPWNAMHCVRMLI